MRLRRAAALALFTAWTVACATGETLEGSDTPLFDGGVSSHADAGFGANGGGSSLGGASAAGSGNSSGGRGGGGAATTGGASGGPSGGATSGGDTSGGGAGGVTTQDAGSGGASDGGTPNGDGGSAAGGAGTGGTGTGGTGTGGTGTGGTGTGGAGTGGTGTGGAGTGGTGTGGAGTGGAGGTCTETEICNGADDDGDGLVDEPSSQNTAACRGCTAVQRNGYAYWFCTSTKDRSPAESDCVAKGGHLASIHDQAENDFVATTMGGGTARFWIGFDDKSSDGNYVWADGTPFDYHYFSCNVSTVTKTSSEDCGNVVGTQGCWDDDDCSGHSFKYVCRAPHTPQCP